MFAWNSQIHLCHYLPLNWYKTQIRSQNKRGEMTTAVIKRQKATKRSKKVRKWVGKWLKIQGFHNPVRTGPPLHFNLAKPQRSQGQRSQANTTEKTRWEWHSTLPQILQIHSEPSSIIHKVPSWSTVQPLEAEIKCTEVRETGFRYYREKSLCLTDHNSERHY